MQKDSRDKGIVYLLKTFNGRPKKMFRWMSRLLFPIYWNWMNMDLYNHGQKWSTLFVRYNPYNLLKNFECTQVCWEKLLLKVIHYDIVTP